MQFDIYHDNVLIKRNFDLILTPFSSRNWQLSKKCSAHKHMFKFQVLNPDDLRRERASFANTHMKGRYQMITDTFFQTNCRDK